MSSPARPFRLTHSRRIAELFDRGVRVGDQYITLIAGPNDLDRTRLAMGVGKRAHGSAVHRNRVKRLCREAFRQVYADLPPCWDLIMLPRGRRSHTVAQLAASLQKLGPKLAAISAEGDHE